MLFIWTQELDLGIDVLDAQHKQIVNLINELDLAVRRKQSKQIKKIYYELLAYTEMHFSHEEELFIQAGYELSDEHKIVHKRFLANMKIPDNDDDIVSSGRKLLSNLIIWLKSHILKEDRHFVEKVKKHLDKQKTEQSSFIQKIRRYVWG